MTYNVFGGTLNPTVFCDSVCPHDKTRTAETETAKLSTEKVHHNTSPTNEY